MKLNRGLAGVSPVALLLPAVGLVVDGASNLNVAASASVLFPAEVAVAVAGPSRTDLAPDEVVDGAPNVNCAGDAEVPVESVAVFPNRVELLPLFPNENAAPGPFGSELVAFGGVELSEEGRPAPNKGLEDSESFVFVDDALVPDAHEPPGAAAVDPILLVLLLLLFFR